MAMVEVITSNGADDPQGLFLCGLIEGGQKSVRLGGLLGGEQLFHLIEEEHEGA